MAANNTSRRDPSQDASLSTLLSPETSVVDPTVGAIATTVDGGAGLSTATAVRSNDSVRSRSRSPHPQSRPTLSSTSSSSPARQHSSRKDRDGERDTRDTSFDLNSLLPASSKGSHTDLSSFEDLDPLRANKNSTSPTKPSLRARLAEKWESSKGLLMVVLAMVFGALMAAVARLMQTGPAPMHTFQIIFARMSITTALSMGYMWWKRVPDAPLGQRGIRILLVARGISGFFGVFGVYYSVKYLPLGEATVITFLAPMVANGACSVLLKEPFTRREQLAAVISFIGVIFIAQPSGFFSSSGPAEATSDVAPGSNSTTATAGDPASQSSTPPGIPEATPIERIIAVLVALLGVCGAATAYTTIRWIGKRAHPLISVNYFSAWCTIVSLVALSVVPDVSFRFPSNLREWLLLLSLGTCGMVMQFLLTAGLARQKGSAAMNMAYTQMIFVLIIDYTLFGTVLTWASWLGSALILGSQIWGAMARGAAMKGEDDKGDDDDKANAGAASGGTAGRLTATRSGTDEEAGLVAGMDHDDDNDDDDDDDDDDGHEDTRSRALSRDDDGRIEMGEMRKTTRPR